MCTVDLTLNIACSRLCNDLMHLLITTAYFVCNFLLKGLWLDHRKEGLLFYFVMATAHSMGRPLHLLWEETIMPREIIYSSAGWCGQQKRDTASRDPAMYAEGDAWEKERGDPKQALDAVERKRILKVWKKSVLRLWQPRKLLEIAGLRANLKRRAAAAKPQGMYVGGWVVYIATLSRLEIFSVFKSSWF